MIAKILIRSLHTKAMGFISRLFFVLLMTLIPSVANALPALDIGPFGAGILDGTAPFNTDGNCAVATDIAAAGDDCGDKNNQVRSQDDVIFNWSITANNFTPGQENLKNVVLEQIITPDANAVVNFSRVPLRCTPEAGGGTNPPSSITTEANGELKLVCNLGEFNEGEQTSFAVYAKVSGESWNGTRFSSRQRVYSLADDGTPNASEDSHVSAPYVISSRPQVDLSIKRHIEHVMVKTTADFGQGAERAFYGYVTVRVATAQKTGTEALQQPLQFKFNLKAFKHTEDGADFTLADGFEYAIHECTPNLSSWTGEVYGKASLGIAYQGGIHQAVTDSGTCTLGARNNNAEPYVMTIDQADLSGEHFPTQGANNVDLTAGPYYFISMRVRFFIPARVVDIVDGTMDRAGAIYVQASLEDFDPVSVSGTVNYGGLQKEPGYNGALMPDGDKSNNLSDRYYYFESAPEVGGSMIHAVYVAANDRSVTRVFQPAYHAGAAILPPGAAYPAATRLHNSKELELSHPRVCTVLDNNTQQLVDRSELGASPGKYAYVAESDNQGFDYTKYVVEYGHVDLSGDDPLHYGYNANTGRYDGLWTVQGWTRCDDAVTTWHTDPTEVAGGIDEVNIVRARLKDGLVDTGKLEAGQQFWLITPLKVRNRFYGGSHAGEPIPIGTVLASFGSARADELWDGDWTPKPNTRPYRPGPENLLQDGDRITVARSSARIESESLEPNAAPNNTASTIAGKNIVWKAHASIQSLIPTPGSEENVRIIAELPPFISYNAQCTAAYADNGEVGTPATWVENNTNRNGDVATGYTRLIWELGTVVANTTIAPRVICTDSDPLAPNNTTIVSHFEIRGDSLMDHINQRSDTHTITLEQVGSIQISQTVDQRLDNRDDSQEYTLRWANFSNSTQIDAPTIINVLPYNGDGTALDVARNPPSAFEGELSLTGVPSIAWLDDSVPSGGSPPLGTWYYSSDSPNTIRSDPDLNTSDWCLESAFGSANCPTNFAGVTALKFVANYQLEKEGDPRQGMKAEFTLQATNNKPGDRYTSRFALDSGSLPTEQFLGSNNLTVYVASYAVGDLLFADVNGNGQFDAGVDSLAPNGVVVNLHDASDDSIVATTTTGVESPGRYLLTKIDGGSFYVAIPASEFQAGGSLDGWDTVVTTAGNDDDLNEGEDQDGYTTGAPITDGVRSNVIMLSAQPPQPGTVPRGNEPLNDNVAGLVSTIADDYSNYTIDIGLIPSYDRGDLPADGSDAPDGTVGATRYGEAGHIPDLSFHLGSVAGDVDATSQFDTDALGDDSDGNGDEDVFDTLALVLGDTAVIAVPVTGAGGYLQAWIDWNGDGDFSDTVGGVSEQISVDAQDNTTTVPGRTDDGDSIAGQITLFIDVPASAFEGVTYARFRWSATSGVASTGNAGVGEVEDYAVRIQAGIPAFVCDSPPLLYQTTTDSGQLRAFDAVTQAFSTTGFSPTGFHLNAIGYREQDNYLYGFNMDVNPRRVVRVGSDGRTHDLGGVAGLPILSTVAGDVHPDGSYWVGSPDSTSLFKIDVTTMPPTLLNTYSNILPLATNDFAFSVDGTRLYVTAKGSADVYEVDVSGATPVRNASPLGEFSVAGSWGAQWTTPTKFYAYDNDTGALHVMDLASGATALLVSDQSYSRNDGASCRREIDFYDYSDAPLAGTSYGGASHTIHAGMVLGSAISAEDGDYDSANADGDENDDGVTLPELTQNQSATISATVVGANGYLQAWIDFDGNGAFDASEQVATDVQDDGTGSDVTSGDGTITVDVAVPLSTTLNQTFARFRWSTTAGLDATSAANDGEVEDYALTIKPGGYRVSGRVYKDANADGINDVTESGVTELPVVLYNRAEASCVSVRTNGDGYYVVAGVLPGDYQVYEASRETIPTPQNCDPSQARDPSGYVSTTDNVSPVITVVDADVDGIDFGDVALPSFAPDNTGAIVPGNATLYFHVFNPPASGSVGFALAANDPDGWSSLLYHDADCNGELEGGELASVLTTSLPTVEGAQVCVAHKVFAPASAVSGQQSIASITADFSYGDGSTLVTNQVLVNNDVTVVAGSAAGEPLVVGEGKLELLKTVQNITQGTDETSVQNQAKPGDTLQYRITYRNTGTAAITDLDVTDTVPAFTALSAGSAACESTPVTLNCTPSVANDAEIAWGFVGNLEAGQQGSVIYRITVE